MINMNYIDGLIEAAERIEKLYTDLDSFSYDMEFKYGIDFKIREQVYDAFNHLTNAHGMIEDITDAALESNYFEAMEDENERSYNT